MQKDSILICMALSVLFSTAVGSPTSTNKKKLSHINHSIANIKAQLSKDQKTRNRYEQQLEKTELASSSISNKLKQTRSQLLQTLKQIAGIDGKISTLKANIGKQQTHLANQVRAAYLLPQPLFLKLLLEQSNTTSIDRMRTYYAYITEKQAATITSLKKDLDTLNDLEKTSQQKTQSLRHIQTTQRQQRNKLLELKKHRQHIIKEINSRILTKNQRLQQLLNNKHTLEHTLTEIQKTKVSIANIHFDKLMGKLQWPTKGKIVHHFGTKIYQSELSWNGVVIEAATDNPVHSIAAGRVVFSNWLPGYGLLIIISHGNGYMSLYGRNHSLYHKVGDLVKQNEVIASVGKSGGYPKPGLYFAIRHNASPQNPARWCH